MAMRGRTKALAIAAGVAAGAAWVARDLPRQMGAKAKGDRLARMQASPQYADGKFHNSVPSGTLPAGSMPGLLAATLRDRDRRHPRLPIPVVAPGLAGEADGLHVTWY